MPAAPSIVPRERVYGKPVESPKPSFSSDLAARREREVREAFAAGVRAAEAKYEAVVARHNSMRDICIEVAKKHGLTLDDLRGERRQHYLVVARWEAAWRCFNETKNSYPAIGRVLHKDHTTIMNAVKKHQERIAAATEHAE